MEKRLNNNEPLALVCCFATALLYLSSRHVEDDSEVVEQLLLLVDLNKIRPPATKAAVSLES